MPALPRITAEQRRTRLVRRHLLAPSVRVQTPHEAAQALIGLHATGPATVHLAAAARMNAPGVESIDHARYDRPSGAPALERIRCTRRTMSVVPAPLAPPSAPQPPRTPAASVPKRQTNCRRLSAGTNATTPTMRGQKDGAPALMCSRDTYSSMPSAEPSPIAAPAGPPRGRPRAR